MPREGRYYAAALVVASLVWLTPHLLHIRRVPDAGDPLFSAWRIARSSRTSSRTTQRTCSTATRFTPSATR